MSTDPDRLLEARFALLAPPPDERDWLDVTRRAREPVGRSPGRGRRRALLLTAALLALLALAGAALALTGSTTGVPAIDSLLDRAPEMDAGPGEPRPDFQPRPGSVSERLEFTVDDTRYTAVGYRNHQGAICAAQVYSKRGGPQRDGMVACNGEDLRSWLAKDAVKISAEGGGRYLNLLGFARADVERIVVTGPTAHRAMKLSPPWSPEPWKGPPIRFFYVFFDGPLDEPPPGHMFGPDLKIEAHLADGRVVRARP